jgi:predicted glycosyltransferase
LNILIDLTHPAHIHFFRNVINILQKEGHCVKLTGRNKDILVDLAEDYGIQMEVFGTARKGAISLGTEMLYRWYRILGIIRQFKPSAMMAIAGTYISLPGKLMGVPTHVFTDTEHAVISNLISFPFATCVYVPRCYNKRIRWNHSLYKGYHELAYLHPKYFKPDHGVLDEVGVKPGEIFSIIRFVGWGAAHDIGRAGFTANNKILAVKELAKAGKVFISSESNLPQELEPHRLNLDVSRIHDLMAYASLIFGESATMVSEGAVLGVPGVFVDPVGRGYTDEQELAYGMVFNFTPERQIEAITKGTEILSDYNRDYWQTKRKTLLNEKIDVTRMLYQIATKGNFS